MNGGRLSDEEALLQGLSTLRRQLAAGMGDEIPAQALRMIAMRFPEEAEQLASLWQDAHQGGERSEIEAVLARIERLHAEDCAEA